MIMVTYNEYLKKILNQILVSHIILQNYQDKPGDLNNIKKELLKINGFFKVILNKISSDKISSSDFKIVQSKIGNYLENYFFEKEIETMTPLYSNDVSRIKNMRLKILEALEDKKLIESIGDLVEKI
jgi:hypothetical protein